MENKPIVTCHGNQTLFSNLHNAVSAGLPREPVEWRRSYGRPPRSIHVQAAFVPFDAKTLPSEDDWSLLGRPFFHTFWTDCDVDGYKNGVRDEIGDWLSILKSKGIVDWLVISVVHDDNKVKAKLLKTSVMDKVKNDFCGKQSDRVVVLTEPTRQESRSYQSWSAVFSRMRTLLLQSYNRHLNRFEEYMRCQRERRTQRGWSFCQYFLLQEELAFMFEMLGLFEDSLVQYDELDALLTQFLLNHAAGETTPWIETFGKLEILSWEGLCLSQPINIAKRQLIKQNRATLLDLRNYMISRQFTLLFLLYRPAEVLERSIPFLHSCLRELRLLQIRMAGAAVCCWVYLSCYEVLRTCEHFKRTGHMTVDSFSRNSVGLWDYTRVKLKELGEILGYMPGTDVVNRELDSVINSVTCLTHETVAPFNGNEKDPDPETRLSDALSSADAFRRQYLELSELVMGTYKHIGRRRCARMVGRELAEFYLGLEQYSKAEPLFIDLLKSYTRDGWNELADQARLQIAKCQRHTRSTVGYIKSCAYITASHLFEFKVRKYYQTELIASVDNLTEDICVRSRPLFDIKTMESSLSSFLCTEEVEIRLELECRLVQAVTLSRVLLSFKPVTSEDTGRARMNSGPGVGRQRHSSVSSVSSGTGVALDDYDLASTAANFHTRLLDIRAHTEVNPKSGDVTNAAHSLVCKMPVTRKDSSGPTLKEREAKMEDQTFQLSLEEIHLEPGLNDVILRGKLGKRGLFQANQACFSYERLTFIHSVNAAFNLQVEVLHDPPSVSVVSPDDDAPTDASAITDEL